MPLATTCMRDLLGAEERKMAEVAIQTDSTGVELQHDPIEGLVVACRCGHRGEGGGVVVLSSLAGSVG